MCEIFSQSVQELQRSDTPKIAISYIDLLRRRYNSVRNAVRYYDIQQALAAADADSRRRGERKWRRLLRIVMLICQRHDYKSVRS